MVIFAAIILLALYGCPIYKWFGVCCPLCGTTRAWICFLSGELRAAFAYHPLFLITPFWLFAAVHHGSLFRKNRIVGAVLICIAVALAVMNLLRGLQIPDGLG